MPPPSQPQTILVLGASGATGRHVVHTLLNRGHKVRVIVRSQPRFDAIINDLHSPRTNLHITEASVTDIPDPALSSHLAHCHAVVSCLGHTLNLAGFTGRLVRDTTERVARLLSARPSPAPRFVLMSSDGVAHPAGSDGPRSLAERAIFWLLRMLVPPHVDNEEAAALLHERFPPDGSGGALQWVVVRPTTLVDPAGEAAEVVVADKPRAGGAFGSGVVARASVGRFMAEVVTDGEMWDRYCFQMPIVYGADDRAETSVESKKKE